MKMKQAKESVYRNFKNMYNFTNDTNEVVDVYSNKILEFNIIKEFKKFILLNKSLFSDLQLKKFDDYKINDIKNIMNR